ncbi:arylsulfatase B-like [Haliotis rufescens]|uniref:arylsulfatase B-like n=1 Tax=Haliotis rufescens TaxID=6454 RepID=UPI00201F8B6D|nr:arylsulfatase B-like [Haliotis rufescens]
MTSMAAVRCVCVLLFIIATSKAATSPHIVFIAADDLGWNDVGWHNPQMITPNLDKLAKAGVILNSSYVAPLCTPSRSSFMTGMYAYHTGLQHMVIQPESPAYLPANFTTLPQKLKDQGYSTHMIGKWHLGFCNWNYTPTFRGFDSFLGYYNGAEDYYTKKIRGGLLADGVDFRDDKQPKYTEEYSATVYARRAVDIIKSHDQSKPLFLYLPFQSVHNPIQVPKRYENMYPNIEDTQRRKYCGMVSAMDEAVGNITQALEENGLMDNLLLVFTADNGGPTFAAANNLPLRGAKSTLWEGGTKGAAFVYSKTLLQKSGYENTEMIHASDWFPTFVRLAGGQADSTIDGVDQWVTLSEGKTTQRTEFIYNIDEVSENGAIRVGDMKLIEGSPGMFNGWYPLPRVTKEEADFPPELLDMTDTSSDTYLYRLLKKHFNAVGSTEYRLFNISADPTEHFDLAEKYPDIVSQLKTTLDTYKKSLRPAFNPPSTYKANPLFYGGLWSPGWC